MSGRRTFALRALWLSLCAALWTANAHASCDPANANADSFPNQTTVIGYDGVLNDRPMRVELTFEAARNVIGFYAFSDSDRRLNVRGHISHCDDNVCDHIDLTFFDAANRPAAVLAGDMPLHNPDGKGWLMGCELISGTWQSSTGRQSLLKLTLDFMLPSRKLDDHIYNIFGADNDETIEHAAIAFRRAVLGNRRDDVAEMMAYPLYAQEGNNRVLIKTRTKLLSDYDRIFVASLRRTIEQSVPLLMFCRYDGAMIGNGEIWFDDRGRVSTINGAAP